MTEKKQKTKEEKSKIEKEIVEAQKTKGAKTPEVKKEIKKEETKSRHQDAIRKKKTEVVVKFSNLHISTKHSIAVSKFIKGKTIEGAITDLEKVVSMKKAVPMKGEIPHRKGMMSGRYPKKAAEHFIKILKSLSANANINGIENPIISEAISNFGQRPYGRFGSVRKKRTHVKLIAKEKK
ncbi:hypothetical protein J4407_00200 [Candidatus Pacearchaeota archaeon]|nr:hypothetical protein [Candidatus Pacearchaeota archaeon]